MRQCQFCKLCNITFFKRWVSYGVILFVSTILTTISAALMIRRVIIKNGSMMNYMKRKGTRECGSAVRNKQTIKKAGHFRVDNLTATTRIYFVLNLLFFFWFKMANPAEV